MPDLLHKLINKAKNQPNNKNYQISPIKHKQISSLKSSYNKNRNKKKSRIKNGLSKKPQNHRKRVNKRVKTQPILMNSTTFSTAKPVKLNNKIREIHSIFPNSVLLCEVSKNKCIDDY